MNNIRICRKNKDLTQKQIAIELGVSFPTVSQWESGIKSPSEKNIERLANFLGVSADYLMGKDDDSEESCENNKANIVNGNNNIIGNGNTVNSTYTDQEKKLLELYNQMDIVGQARLIAFAADLLSHSQNGNL